MNNYSSMNSKRHTLPTQINKPFNSASLNTTEESIFISKLQKKTNKRSSTFYPKILASNKNSPLTTRSSINEKNNSILNCFQKTISHQLASELDKEISYLSQSLTTFKRKTKTLLRIHPHPMILRKGKQKVDMIKVTDNNNKDKENEKELNAIETLTIPTDTNQTPSIRLYKDLKTIINPKKRIRRFDRNIKINPKWKLSLGIYPSQNKMEKCLLTDLKYQSNYLKDQLKLLIENFQYYKTTILSSNNILSALKNKTIQTQTNHNKIIEEQCVLLDQIPRQLLKSFYSYSDKFISVTPVYLFDYDHKVITNEAECFIEDARIMNQLFTFLQCCVKVYAILVNETEEVILTPKDFDDLMEIIQKARYNMNVLIATAKNWISDLNFDMKLIGDYKKKVMNDKGNSNEKYNKTDFISGVIHRQLHFKKSDQALKLQRINNAFRKDINQSIEEEEEAKEKYNGEDDKDKVNEKGLKISKINKKAPIKAQSLINSALMIKVLKYCRTDVRKQIISLQIQDRFNNATTNSK